MRKHWACFKSVGQLQQKMAEVDLNIDSLIQRLLEGTWKTNIFARRTLLLRFFVIQNPSWNTVRGVRHVILWKKSRIDVSRVYIECVHIYCLLLNRKLIEKRLCPAYRYCCWTPKSLLLLECHIIISAIISRRRRDKFSLSIYHRGGFRFVISIAFSLTKKNVLVLFSFLNF